MNVVDPPAAVPGAGVPVTVIRKEPGGVAVVTVMVSMLVPVGVTGLVPVANAGVAPAGSPVAESVTGLVRPLVRVAVMVTAAVPDVPVLTPAAGALFDNV